MRETVETVSGLLEESGNEPVTMKTVGKELGLDKQPTHRRVQLAIEGGYLKNLEERKGRPYRLVLEDAMPEDREILPEPEKLWSSSQELDGLAVLRSLDGI